MGRKRIGEILLERGIINPAQLEEGLAHHRQTRQRLGVALIQKGFVKESDLARALSEATGFPEVDLSALQPEWSAIHTLRTAFCEANDLFPFALQTMPNGKKKLLVAMSDPLNIPAIEEIEFTIGVKVSARIAPLSAVRAAILRYYHRKNPADEAPSSGMTIVQGKGVSLHVPDEPEEAVETAEVLDEEIIEGEEYVEKEVTARTRLAELIKAREERKRSQKASAKKSGSPTESLSEDLDYLLGMRDQPDPVEQLERKFWALMRLMAKKGLLTNEEFAKELDDAE
jgi:hypothetical protein